MFFLWYMLVRFNSLVYDMMTCAKLIHCVWAFKVVPYTSGKIWSARLIFLFFEYIHCNKYQNFSKFQPTDSEL